MGIIATLFVTFLLAHERRFTLALASKGHSSNPVVSDLLLELDTSRIYPNIPEKARDCQPDVDLYLLHMRKAGGRSLRCTFNINCAMLPFLKLFPPAIPNVVARMTTGHKRENEIKTKYKHALTHRRNGTIVLYGSILRHPITRLISSFSTSVGRADDTKKHQLVEGCAFVGHVHVCSDAITAMETGVMSLEEFARSSNTGLAMNYQVQLLSNSNVDLQREPSANQERALFLSKRALDLMDVIFLTERFNESFAIMSCILEDRGNHILRHINQCSNWNPHSTADQISQHTKDLLETRNSLDMQLYNYAEVIFQHQIKIYAPRKCFQRVQQSLQKCDRVAWFGDKHNPQEGSFNETIARDLLKGKHASEYMLRMLSCPIL
eukprot:gene9009-1339_t